MFLGIDSTFIQGSDYDKVWVDNIDIWFLFIDMMICGGEVK